MRPDLYYQTLFGYILHHTLFVGHVRPRLTSELSETAEYTTTIIIICVASTIITLFRFRCLSGW